MSKQVVRKCFCSGENRQVGSSGFFQHAIAEYQKHEQQTGEDDHSGLNRFCVKKLELKRSLSASFRSLSEGERLLQPKRGPENVNGR